MHDVERSGFWKRNCLKLDKRRYSLDTRINGVSSTLSNCFSVCLIFIMCAMRESANVDASFPIANHGSRLTKRVIILHFVALLFIPFPYERDLERSPLKFASTTRVFCNVPAKMKELRDARGVTSNQNK